MADNIFEAQPDIEKKSKLKKFYDTYKFLIFSFILLILLLFGSFSFYLEHKEKGKILLSENYLQAKIYLEAGNNDKALNVLKQTVFEDDPTYSTLSLFLIINQNLITDHREIVVLFNHLLENNKFSKEEKNLLIYKKTLFESNFMDESELLDSMRPLLNTDNLWKPHALLLLGDYFVAKGENVKAIEFYQEIFTINNLDKDLYNQARSQLEIISND